MNGSGYVLIKMHDGEWCQGVSYTGRLGTRGARMPFRSALDILPAQYTINLTMRFLSQRSGSGMGLRRGIPFLKHVTS